MYWQFCSVMIWKANTIWDFETWIQVSNQCSASVNIFPDNCGAFAHIFSPGWGEGTGISYPGLPPFHRGALGFRLEIQTWCRILWESPSSSSQIVMSVREGKNLLRFWVVFFLDRDLLHFFLCLSSHNATHHYKYSETVLTRICMGRSAIYPRLIWLLKCTHHREIMLSK